MARVKEIQVSGLQCFPGNRWREAFLHYLFGVWGDHGNVTYRPKIVLDGLGIRWDGETVDGKYYVYGNRPSDDSACPEVPSERKLVVSRWQTTFEQGLIRFVKNDRILMLELQLPNDSFVRLWKNPRERGFLGIMVWGPLPSSLCNPY